MQNARVAAVGDMFSGKVYNLGSNKIHLNCPHCNLCFEIKPGYFYAAMYVSYALNVGFLSVWQWLLILSPTILHRRGYIPGVIIGGCVLLAPVIFVSLARFVIILVIAQNKISTPP